jgi:ATP-dependent 26S proteasome regulatory subunit
MKVVASAIVDKYIGESARVIREMFGKQNIKLAVLIFLYSHYKVMRKIINRV